MSSLPIAPGLGSIPIENDLQPEFCLSPEIMNILDDAEKEHKERNTTFNQNDISIKINTPYGDKMNISDVIVVPAYTSVYDLKQIIGNIMKIPPAKRNKILIVNDLVKIDDTNNKYPSVNGRPLVFVIFFIYAVCGSDNISYNSETITTEHGGKRRRRKTKTKLKKGRKKSRRRQHVNKIRR